MPKDSPPMLLPKVPFKTHPLILEKAWRRWELAGFKGAPPDPSELLTDEDYETEVLLFGQIVKFFRDSDKRKAVGLDG